MSQRQLSVPLLCSLGLALSEGARAQDGGAGEVAETSQPGAGGGAEAGPAPVTRIESRTQYIPYGLPAPGTDINEGLPSSSQPTTDINATRDTFDTIPRRESSGPLRGREGAPVVGVGTSRAARVPDLHTVKQGDTLWDLCDHYYQNPWKWPEVWSYNPQLQNPHWIYPGDQLWIRAPGGPSRGATSQPDSTPGGLLKLSNYGYLADPEGDRWGKVLGSREEQMMLADGNHVYLEFRRGAPVKPGQSLTVFVESREPKNVPGARMPPGKIVTVKGTVRVDLWDPEKRLARAKVIESVDVIERGARVGPVSREFELPSPQAGTVDLWARILTSFYPHVYFGNQQVLFLDKGESDGLRPGNRLFVVRKGDSWRRTLTTVKKMARVRMRTDVPENARWEMTPLDGDEDDFPEEIVGELRIVSTQKYSALAVVVEAERALEVGDRCVARKGF